MERSTAVQDAYARLCDAYAAADPAVIEELLAPDGCRVIGTDPAEWWGPDPGEVMDIHRRQFAELGSLAITPGDPECFSQGDVGWVADRPTLRLPDGRELRFRFTGVLSQRSNTWRFLQMHLSIGVPNQEAVGRELTTEVG